MKDTVLDSVEEIKIAVTDHRNFCVIIESEFRLQHLHCKTDSGMQALLSLGIDIYSTG